ncbi:MAG: GIY-YIG nuclease family protein [Bacteroidetes bacterium]|nr:GIY-YIG nuclease family protein [Bacteroidota bacterium]
MTDQKFSNPFVIDEIPRAKGIYLLEMELPLDTEIEIGKNGSYLFRSGCYYYTGSAFGPGGLRGRLSHHLRPASKPHWHIDRLKEHAIITNISVFHADRDFEHELAMRLAKEFQVPVPGFGSSGCNCPAHLFYRVKEN